jgi:hypothetical protein
MKRRPHRQDAAAALARRLERHAAEWRRLPPDVPVGLRNPCEVAAELEAAARALREVHDTMIDRARRAIRQWLLEPTAADRAFERARILNAGEILSKRVTDVFGPRIKRDLELAASRLAQPIPTPPTGPESAEPSRSRPELPEGPGGASP